MHDFSISSLSYPSSSLPAASLAGMREETEKHAADVGRALAGIGKSVGGAVARYGQRQLHGLTGWTPPAGLRAIRAGAYNAEQNLGRALRTNLPGEISQARKGLAAAEKAESMGLTSIPGFARSLVKDPKATLHAGASEQWHNMPGWAKALTVGAPALEAGHALVTPDKPDGPGKGERVGRALAAAGAGLTMGAMPMTTGMLAQGAVASLGGRMGRGVDHLRRRIGGSPGGIQAPRDNTPYNGEHVPFERITSDRAAGIPPEAMA